MFVSICPAVERVIRRRLSGRHPYPAIFAFRAGSPQERMAFARLNPSHTDTHERLQQTLPLLTHKTGVQMDDQIACLPYTDQRSYVRYLQHVAPSFTRRLLALLATQQAGEDYLSERGRSFPTVAEEGMDRGGNDSHNESNSGRGGGSGSGSDGYSVRASPSSPSVSAVYPPPPPPPPSSGSQRPPNASLAPPTASSSSSSTAFVTANTDANTRTSSSSSGSSDPSLSKAYPPPPPSYSHHPPSTDSLPLTMKFPPPPTTSSTSAPHGVYRPPPHPPPASNQ